MKERWGIDEGLMKEGCEQWRIWSIHSIQYVRSVESFGEGEGEGERENKA